MKRPQADRGRNRSETFEAVATEWLELQSKALSAETISILGTRLKSFLNPYIGIRPVVAITAQELLAALRRIEARGSHETATAFAPWPAGCFAMPWLRAVRPMMLQPTSRMRWRR